MQVTIPSDTPSPVACGDNEETGVWAHPEADLGCESWQVNGKAVKTHFFLMQAIGKGRRQDKDREHRWVKLEEAKAITVT